jgi:hypothetical protein
MQSAAVALCTCKPRGKLCDSKASVAPDWTSGKLNLGVSIRAVVWAAAAYMPKDWLLLRVLHCWPASIRGHGRSSVATVSCSLISQVNYICVSADCSRIEVFKRGASYTGILVRRSIAPQETFSVRNCMYFCDAMAKLP